MAEGQPTPAPVAGGQPEGSSNAAGGGDTSNMNLFVANLSNDVTDAVLYDAFAKYGRLLTCKVMLDIHTGISRGFGFVLFESTEEGSMALKELHGSQVGQKNIFISVAQTSGKSGLQHTPKLYVRNVPKSVPMEELKEHFSKHGEIVRIHPREDTTQTNAPREHRAYLQSTVVIFIEYKTAREADECVRHSHATRPWPNMDVPLLAKPAETSQMRNERRARQQSRGSAGSSTHSAGQSGGGSSTTMHNSSSTAAYAQLSSMAPMSMMPTAVMPTGIPTAAGPDGGQGVPAPMMLVPVPQGMSLPTAGPPGVAGVPPGYVPMLVPQQNIAQAAGEGGLFMPAAAPTMAPQPMMVPMQQAYAMPTAAMMPQQPQQQQRQT